MKDLFINDELNRQFAEEGFVKVEFLHAGDIAELEKVFADNCATANNFIDGVMYFSLIANSVEGNKKIRTEVRRIFNTAYQRTFKNYRPLAESFLAKAPGQHGDLMLHQDWNYVDERQYNSATIWCPLVDITEENGAMYLIPKSHRFFQNIRSATYPTSRFKAAPALAPHTLAVAVNAGEALIFHQALWHGSHPNLSNRDRVISTSIVVQDDAPFVYFHKNADTGMGEIYELGDDAFFEELAHMAAGNAPRVARLAGALNNYHHAAVNEAELASKAALGTAAGVANTGE